MAGTVDWDDWRVVDALARTANASEAAKCLGMNVSTVVRRIDRIEDRLGVQLFERGRDGARTTLQAEAVLDDLKTLRQTTEAIETQIIGLDEVPAGEVKLSLNLHVYSYLIPEVPRLLNMTHPKIKVILDVTDRVVSLKNRDADVVIRGSNDPNPDLFGRRVMRLPYAVYGDASWAAKILAGDRPIDAHELPQDIDWIGYTGDLDVTAPAAWQRRHVPQDRVLVESNEVGAMTAIAASGIACGVMPCFVADRHPGLVRLTNLVPGLHTELWVLTLKELRRTARVSALVELVLRAFKARANENS